MSNVIRTEYAPAGYSRPYPHVIATAGTHDRRGRFYSLAIWRHPDTNTTEGDIITQAGRRYRRMFPQSQLTASEAFRSFARDRSTWIEEV
jgi:hypothetical protein